MKNCVARLRKQAGMTQEQLAKSAQISRPHLGMIETGAANPTVAVAASIAKVLGCTMDELFCKQNNRI